jgi:hypothetical protein
VDFAVAGAIRDIAGFRATVERRASRNRRIAGGRGALARIRLRA